GRLAARRHRRDAGRSVPLSGPFLQELSRHGLGRRHGARLGRPLFPTGHQGRAQAGAGRCRGSGRLQGPGRQCAASTVWRLARRHGLRGRQGSGRFPRQGGIHAHLGRRASRKPRARRDHHAREPELPERGVTFLIPPLEGRVAPKAPGGVSTVSAAKTSTEKISPDPFAPVREATLAHRAQHGCGAYPYDNGALLGAPRAVIDAVERDGEHVRLAREQVEAHGMAGHIVVHEGEFSEVMRRLDPGYDVAFFDGLTPSRPLLKEMRRLLRGRGLLISANLTHTGAEAYLAALQEKKSWLTAFIDEDHETALSIKL